MSESTVDRLVRALKEAGAPSWMVQRAAIGGYDDFKSDSATPITNLVRDAGQCSLDAICKRAMDGEFDASEEEANAWYEKEGRHLIK